MSKFKAQQSAPAASTIRSRKTTTKKPKRTPTWTEFQGILKSSTKFSLLRSVIRHHSALSILRIKVSRVRWERRIEQSLGRVAEFYHKEVVGISVILRKVFSFPPFNGKEDKVYPSALLIPSHSAEDDRWGGSLCKINTQIWFDEVRVHLETHKHVHTHSHTPFTQFFFFLSNFEIKRFIPM